MMQKDFAVERMKATLRIDKIESDLNETAQAIKRFKFRKCWTKY